MHEQFPLIVELILFTGYKEEAETLFCLSNELSKDIGLCYNMITLTPTGLICRAAAKGYYKTVKNIKEFYDLQESDDPYDGKYGYMFNRLNGTMNDENEFGPMFYALENGHLEIYRFLLGKIDSFHIAVNEFCLPALLICCLDNIERIGYDKLAIVVDDISSTVIDKISDAPNGEWRMMCFKRDIEEIIDCIRFIYEDWTDNCTKRGKITPWNDVLYSLAIKLKITPGKYMTDIDRDTNKCKCYECEEYYADYSEEYSEQPQREPYICDSFIDEIENSHLDGYERMRLKLVN